MNKIKKNKMIYILLYANIFAACVFLILISISNYKISNLNEIINSQNSVMYHIEVDESIRPSTLDSIKKFKTYLGTLSVKKIAYRNIGGKFYLDIYDFDNTNRAKENILDIIINKYTYKELKNHYFDGDYLISGDKNRLHEFGKSIESMDGFRIGNIDKNMYSSIIISSGFINNYYILCFIISVSFSLIGITGLVFNKRKNIYIYKLLGYSSTKTTNKILIVKHKVDICFFLFITSISFIFLVFCKGANIMESIWISKMIFVYILALVFYEWMLMMYFVYTYKSIREKNKRYQNEFRMGFNNILFIIVSAIVVILSSVSYSNIQEYKRVSHELESLTKIKKYANVDTSKAFLDENFDLWQYRHKHKKIWGMADKKGGIFLLPGEKYLGFVEFPDAEFYSDYVVINNNYLREIDIKDIDGNRISPQNNDKYTISVLIPQRYRNDSRVIEEIKSEHIFRVCEGLINNKKLDNVKIDNTQNYDEYSKQYKNHEKILIQYLGDNIKKLKEKIIYIDDNQKIYSFSNEFPVNEKGVRNSNYILSPIVYIINSDNYNDLLDEYIDYGGSTYSTSIDSAYMHFKINDYYNPEKDIMPILKNVELDKENVKIFTISDLVEKSINESKQYMQVMVLMFILNIVVLYLLLSQAFYQYTSDNRREISIKYFMGYTRIKIYKLFISRILSCNIATYLLINFISNKFREFLALEFNIYLNGVLINISFILFLIVEIIYLSTRIRKERINYIDIK
ncbi:hypothetical protein [Peptostreptococcus porci]|uniref:hypothetical protein n=1 Tax=Peptostreptococcus porci TaxID=2652282 RepID=UPI002A7483E4|nr:hypothetical protein [Peptostreptococcus porci]MDY2794108.1 hypothetical protein [Peptostreptococcus porci]